MSVAAGISEEGGAAEAAEDIRDRMARVLAAETDDFFALLEIAGLRRERDLRFFDWSGVDFRGLDLEGCDFTGARLVGCSFDGARIAGARFDMAEVDRRALRRARDWVEHVSRWRRGEALASGRHLADLARFSDAPFAPELVVIPAGEFLMGSQEEADEQPPHNVTVKRFALGKYPVTFDEYDAFCAATGREKPSDNGWGRGRRPAINVSWEDAQAYFAWLSRETGKAYRLPSEAEWEYACRAETETRYSCGDSITAQDANFGGNVGKTTEVGSYPANPWGLYDMHGTVWEWVEDHWHKDYEGAPDDGSAWVETGSGHLYMLRGGSWYDGSGSSRSAFREAFASGARYDYYGLRCARDLP